MSILSPTQIAAAAVQFANAIYVIPGVTATLNLTQIEAGITAIDTVMSDTPAAFASAFSGSPNVGSAFGTAVTAAVPGISTGQAAVMLIFWVQQVTGVTP
jgi:hypothetical protein